MGASIVRAVVVGGGGLTGRCAVRDLAASHVFESVVAADVDLGLARAAAQQAGSQRASAEVIDVRDRGRLEALLREADVCVNAVQYTFNLHVMEACRSEGVPYLDFGGLFHTTRRQLELDASFRSAGVLAVVGLGQVPGISNLLAMEGCRDLEQVDRIVLRDGWRDFTENAPEILFTWSPSTFLDEMVEPAQVFERGEYRAYPPLSGSEIYDFPSPVGPTRVYRTLHSEPATLPESLRSKGLRHCEWKEGGPGIDLLRTMAALGLASREPVEVSGAKVVPREFLLALLRRDGLLGVPAGITIRDWEVLDIEIVGRGTQGPVERHAIARFPPRPDWNLSATEYAVGVAGSIGAQMIARHEISGSGVFPPERCVPVDRFRAELRSRGIATSVTPPETPLPSIDPMDNVP